MTQPEALRLATELLAGDVLQAAAPAAAELRRLHAENERLKTACAKEFESVQELDNRVTADEALLRQALEALEWYAVNYWRPEAIDSAITALRERLGGEA